MNDSGEPVHASKPSLAPSLRDLLEEERHALGEHPDIDDWEALHAGRLGKERAESLRDHLAVCQDCADLFLDLAAFSGAEPPEGTPPVSDAQVMAALRQIQGRLRDEAPAEAVAEPVEPTPVTPADRRVAVFPPQRQEAPEPPKTSWRAPLAMAAGILMAVVGLATWNQLGKGTPSLQVNVPVTDETVELVAHEAVPTPRGTQRGVSASRGGEEKPLPAAEEHSLGLPLPEGTAPYDGYHLKVENAAGNLIFETERLELQSGMDKGSGEGFTLRVTRESLPTGGYTAQLYGVNAGRPQRLIASYVFEITP